MACSPRYPIRSSRFPCRGTHHPHFHPGFAMISTCQLPHTCLLYVLWPHQISSRPFSLQQSIRRLHSDDRCSSQVSLLSTAFLCTVDLVVLLYRFIDWSLGHNALEGQEVIMHDALTYDVATFEAQQTHVNFTDLNPILTSRGKPPTSANTECQYPGKLLLQLNLGYCA
jgi:hypothetical protein